jgi:hypothetical protein
MLKKRASGLKDSCNRVPGQAVEAYLKSSGKLPVNVKVCLLDYLICIAQVLLMQRVCTCVAFEGVHASQAASQCRGGHPASQKCSGGVLGSRHK